MVTNLRLPSDLPYRPELTEVLRVAPIRMISTAEHSLGAGVEADGFVA
jgi:hypothetical protein